jgi:hypothetical protein
MVGEKDSTVPSQGGEEQEETEDELLLCMYVCMYDYL